MPNNANLFRKTNFILGSPDWDFMIEHIIEVTLPGLTFSHIERGGSRFGSRLNVQGDSLSYNVLDCTILLSEDLKEYRFLSDYAFKTVNQSSGQFAIREFPLFLQINNSKGHQIMVIEYKNAKIEGISDVQLSTQDDIAITTMNLTVRYDYFEILQDMSAEEFFAKVS